MYLQNTEVKLIHYRNKITLLSRALSKKIRKKFYKIV